MATHDPQSDPASSSPDDDAPPSTIEYPGDVDEQEIKLDLADRVSETDAVSGIESVAIDEQDDGSQLAHVTWELEAPDSSSGGESAQETPPTPAAEDGDTEPADTADADDADETDADTDTETESGSESESESDAVDNTTDAADTPDDDVAGAEEARASGDEPTAPEPVPEADETEAEADTDEAETDAAETDAEGPETVDETPAADPARPATFDATIEVGDLRTALAPVDALVDECRFHLAEDGLTIRAVDAANVAMVDLQLSAEAFDAYQADTGMIGVNLDRFLEAIAMGDTDNLVHLALTLETGKLELVIDNLEFTMALIDPETIRAEPDIPDLDLPAHVTCRTDDLDRVVTATDMVADHVRLAVDPEAELFVADAKGDTDSVRLERTADDLEALTPGDADSLFSLDYLSDIVGAIPRDIDVSFALGEGFPLQLEYTLVDGHGDVETMVAPRIENE